MLKKAGLVVAASAASLLAVSPLAFAGDKGDPGHGGHHSANVIDKSADGLISGLNGNNVNVPITACNNDIPVQVPVLDIVPVQANLKDLTTPLNGALGILGSANVKSNQVTDNSRACGVQSGAGDSQN